MPPVCRICRHPKAAAIALALVAGDSLRDIAGRLKVSKSALDRHRAHLGGTALVKLVEAHREVEAETLGEEIANLKRDAHRLKRKAEDSGDLRCALAAVKSLGEIVLRLEEMMPTAAVKEPVLVTFTFPPSHGPVDGTELASPASAIPEDDEAAQ